MQSNWEADDEEAFEGPDAYIEGDEIDYDDIYPTGELIVEGHESSAQGTLRSFFQTSEGDTQQNPPTPMSRATLQDLTRLLGESSAIFGGALLDLEDSDESADEDPDYEEVEYEQADEDYAIRRLYQRPAQFSPVLQPQEAGLKLLMGGEFGRVGQRLASRRNNVNIAKLLLDRGTMPLPATCKEDITSNLVPNTNGTAVASSVANIYSGQFSGDSSFYYTCGQDFQLNIYNMTSPPSGNSVHLGLDHHQASTMKIMKTIQGCPGSWTITDSHLSPDNERMIYSSITSTVYMTSTLDSSPTQIPIHFADQPQPQFRRMRSFYDEDAFGIWSCRFSADGNEVVAGGSGKIFVYDLLADRRTVKIAAHNDDVNSCCWADSASGNILISASDDSFIKVWDRRSLCTAQKPSGVLVGHTEGITSVAAKGDGRYIISNGKDQAMRLWDLRKMHSSAEFDKFSDKFYGTRFDYRYGHYPKPKYLAHPRDCSVMTYRGHQVLRTLIRCQFSPIETTGGQYLFSGSTDGKIHIWSLDGRVVQVLDRSRSLPMFVDPSGPELEPIDNPRRKVCVRDVSWHSQEPIMMSVGWESIQGGSTVARHEWKGLSKMSNKLEDWVQKQQDERGERAARWATRRYVPGASEFEDSDEEE